MKQQKAILLALTLAMIGGTGWFLADIRAIQRLGKPGVKTRPLPGSRNLEVILPEHVLDYDSEPIPLAAIVTNNLPSDTSFGQRLYKSASPGSLRGIQVSVVLMGGDRTSLHKPQLCLVGQGWKLGPSAFSKTTVPVQRPYPYELPVGRLIGSKQEEADGKQQEIRVIYVYYYVADGELNASDSDNERMWSIARQLIRTGVLQRWAYISYTATCLPGQEDATFERMKTFIAESAPEFQLTPAQRDAAVAASK